MALLTSIGVGHVAGLPCCEAASMLHAASMLPDKDAGPGHARFLGWITADHTTESTPSSPVAAFRFPAPFSPS
jgi:hypothetical protein